MHSVHSVHFYSTYIHSKIVQIRVVLHCVCSLLLAVIAQCCASMGAALFGPLLILVCLHDRSVCWGHSCKATAALE